LAEEVVKAGAIEQLSICVQDPETSLKKVATLALSEIAKHNPELAGKIAENAGTLKSLTNSLKDRDLELRQNTCLCLANIAKHSEELAQKVVAAELFPKIITHCLKEEKKGLQRQAAQCIKEIASQNMELAKTVVAADAIGPMVDYLKKIQGSGKLPAIMALGFIAGFDPAMAKSVVQAKGHSALVDTLRGSPETHIKAAAAWSLGQIGKHSAVVGQELTKEKVLESLLEAFNQAEEKGDLQKKARRALKSMIEQCQEMSALRPLLEAPEKIVKHVVAQMCNILKNKTNLKQEFAENGCLERLQEIKAQPGSKLQTSINEINALFPEDVVRYFTKDYMNTLIKQQEGFH
jgi:hypothetical protein